MSMGLESTGLCYRGQVSVWFVGGRGGRSERGYKKVWQDCMRSRDLLVAGDGSAGDNYNTGVGKRRGGEEEDRGRQTERGGETEKRGEERGGAGRLRELKSVA